MKQVPDQIFDQVLYRKDVPDMKMQVSGDPVLSGERLCEKNETVRHFHQPYELPV